MLKSLEFWSAVLGASLTLWNYAMLQRWRLIKSTYEFFMDADKARARAERERGMSPFQHGKLQGTRDCVAVFRKQFDRAERLAGKNKNSGPEALGGAQEARGTEIHRCVWRDRMFAAKQAMEHVQALAEAKVPDAPTFTTTTSTAGTAITTAST